MRQNATWRRSRLGCIVARHLLRSVSRKRCVYQKGAWCRSRSGMHSIETLASLSPSRRRVYQNGEWCRSRSRVHRSDTLKSLASVVCVRMEHSAEAVSGAGAFRSVSRSVVCVRMEHLAEAGFWRFVQSLASSCVSESNMVQKQARARIVATLARFVLKSLVGRVCQKGTNLLRLATDAVLARARLLVIWRLFPVQR